MTDDVLKKKIQEDPDFILMPRAGNSLKKAIEMNPDGIEIPAIAKALMLTEEEVQCIFDTAIKKMRQGLSEYNED